VQEKGEEKGKEISNPRPVVQKKGCKTAPPKLSQKAARTTKKGQGGSRDKGKKAPGLGGGGGPRPFSVLQYPVSIGGQRKKDQNAGKGDRRRSVKIDLASNRLSRNAPGRGGGDNHNFRDSEGKQKKMGEDTKKKTRQKNTADVGPRGVMGTN